MSVGKPIVDEAALPLPETAPVVRITAGLGSAGQKTWNLRKPITLIGGKRPAHIVLKDRNISKAHCVLVNTGTEVLIKDLFTSAGTTCNRDPVDLAVLSDGDFLTLGSSHIQVAITSVPVDSDDSGYGLEYVEPTKLVGPVSMTLDHTDRTWTVDSAVTLIGRHKQADILLDHDAVAQRHAVLFRYGREVAIYDLGGGLSVDGQSCAMARLSDESVITVGPFLLRVRLPQTEGPPKAGDQDGAQAVEPAAPTSASPEPDAGQEPAAPAQPESARQADSLNIPSPPNAEPDPTQALEHIEVKLGQLQRNIQGSWDRMNTWESRLRDNADELDKQESDLAARTTEVEAKEAALRGQLHDLSCYHTQIMDRERELAAEAARIQEARDDLTSTEAALKEREEAVARRGEELKRREHVFAQRWTRLLHATCPHCGNQVGEGS